MKITILTQYYPPETGAPQNRLHSLAQNLKNQGVEIEVITAMPSYPKNRVFKDYRGKLLYSEVIDGIPIRRSWIYVSRSKRVVPRLLNYFSFVVSSFFNGLFSRRSDYVICESPPLFLGISAYLLCRLKGSKLIFNVSDLWPESAEKLGIVTNSRFLNLAYRLESFLYRNSVLITGQTMGIVKDIKSRFPSLKCHWMPNGIDKHLYSRDSGSEEWKDAHGISGKNVFMYAGIVGHAQALDIILRARALMLESYPTEARDTAFVIVGDGPDKSRLLDLQNKLGTDVIFIPNIPKNEVLGMIASCFAYIIPLKNIDLFLGAIPSKIFDPLAFGIPVLLAVDGEARNLFIEKGRAGIFIEPENENSLLYGVRQFLAEPEEAKSMGDSGKQFVEANFDRSQIAEDFLEQLSNA